MDYRDFSKEVSDENNMLPKGTDAQRAVDILAEHFLGNYIIYGYPATNAQWNSEVVYEILRRYPSGKIRRIHK